MIVGFLPAAGKAERFNGVLKEFLPFGKDLRAIDYSIAQMVKIPVDRLYITTTAEKAYGHMSYLQNQPIPTAYLTQKNPTGMVDALKLLWPFVNEEFEDEEILICLSMPDTVYSPVTALRRLVHKALSSNGLYTGLLLGFHQVESPHLFGVGEFKNTKLVGIEDKPEKPKSMWIWSCAVFRPSIFSYLSRTQYTGKEKVLSDVFNEMIKDKTCQYIKFTSPYVDVGDYGSYLKALRRLE